MDCSVPAFLVLHCLPEFAQTHVHWVGDAIQPSHPLSPPFSSCSQSFPASRSSSMSQLFSLGGQSIGASASASVLPMDIKEWFPLKYISLKSKGLSRVFSSTTIWKHQFFGVQPSLCQLSQLYMTTGKTIALTIRTFVGKFGGLIQNKFILSYFKKSEISIIQPKSRGQQDTFSLEALGDNWSLDFVSFWCCWHSLTSSGITPISTYMAVLPLPLLSVSTSLTLPF